MRHSLARPVVGLLALLSFASVALAQGSKLPGRDDPLEPSSHITR